MRADKQRDMLNCQNIPLSFLPTGGGGVINMCARSSRAVQASYRSMGLGLHQSCIGALHGEI